MERLGIIIPAYKATYLQYTLDSIANQTAKNFDLYVFNDNSPEDLGIIIRKYSSIINEYISFEENWGGKNLVAHWNRCLANVNNEFIWMFSDDDILDAECVEMFYKTIENSVEDVYRFNTTIIDGFGGLVLDNPPHPVLEDSKRFLIDRLYRKRNSYLPEYIFRRSMFLAKGNSFVYFPLAWNSDDATWVKLGLDKGIRTISKAQVHWRGRSGDNISSKQDNCGLKFVSDILFHKWIKEQFMLNHFEVRWASWYWLIRRCIKKYSEHVDDMSFVIAELNKNNCAKLHYKYLIILPTVFLHKIKKMKKWSLSEKSRK